MIKRNYYALVAGLPDIFSDDKKMAFSTTQFRSMLKGDLHSSDFALVRLFFIPFDHNNLINLLFKKDAPWDERGNMTKADMEIVVDKKQFHLNEEFKVPAYLSHLVEIAHDEEAIENEQIAQRKLNEKYYALLLSQKNNFVRDVAQYQITATNILTALNGRKHGISFENDLVGNSEVVKALNKSKSRDFGLSREIENIEEFIQIFETDHLLERELKVDNHFWNYLEDRTFFHYFTIERVLAFLLKLFIVERWVSLDKQRGEEMFNKLLEELNTAFQFPEEFTLGYGKR